MSSRSRGGSGSSVGSVGVELVALNSQQATNQIKSFVSSLTVLEIRRVAGVLNTTLGNGMNTGQGVNRTLQL
ncbi:MAG: hypothetical protein L0H53_10255 [Candidatus Nitrosocosmicus sp.]|nr:hypothetical protein [Candidatus Nitrosocosmicus sp.]MDN5867045.1 hypothetical protein [Candidatus Nitrosocosmicus sp.]